MNIKEIAQEWITANDHLPLMTCGCGHCPGCIADERYYLIRDLLYSATDHEEEVKKLKEEIELLKVQDAAIDEWHEEIETRTKESVQRAVAAEREAIKEVDMKHLHDALTEGFVCREYTDRYGPMDYDFRQKAVSLYHNDSMFHNRVCSVVSSVLVLVEKHIRQRGAQ